MRDWQDILIEDLKDTKEAEAYLQVALEEYESDGDWDMFLVAMKNVIEAQGGMTWLAKKTGLNRPNLYNALKAGGNPTFATIGKIINALGYGFVVSKRPLPQVA